MKLTDVNLSIIQKVFWLSMHEGWCSDTKVAKQESLLLPGYKLISFRVDKFSVLDAYCTTPLNDMSEGKIVIWFEQVPVWTMNYGGQYPKEVIPLVKLAIQQSLAFQQFSGGRGPQQFLHHDFIDYEYTNELKPGYGEFGNFKGYERVLQGDVVVGFHNYQGTALI